MLDSNLVSAHIFLYYKTTGQYLLEKIAQSYNGPIYLSLVDGNEHNDYFLEIAKNSFNDTKVIYVDDYGTDQYGFYSTFIYDFTKKPWILYCHDKNPSKKTWLEDALNIFDKITDKQLADRKIGIISSSKYRRTQPSFDDLLTTYKGLTYSLRKDIVQAMHTLVWLHELERILLSKYNLGNKDFKCPIFSAGNIFLIRRDIVNRSHGCVYEEFFNRGVYRTDGEVEHGLERFYFYVSQCLGYENIFI